MADLETAHVKTPSSGEGTAKTPSSLGEDDNIPYDDDIQDKPLTAAVEVSRRPPSFSVYNKRRRTSLLGNLMTHGRLSRGLSLAHLTFHLTKPQREEIQRNREEGVPQITEDYYFLQETEHDRIYLEKPENIPGVIPPSLMTIQDMVSAMGQAQPDHEVTPPVSPPPPPPPQEPEETPPDSAIFPVQRNTVELQSKLTVVRNLRTYEQHNKIVEGKCYYSEDEIDLTILKAKPLAFIIFGKPGIGRTTLGMKLAEKLHAIHINPENVIEYFRGPTEPIHTVKVNERLDNGETIPDGVVLELIEKRIREFDILHRGYVLEGFPLVTSDDLPVDSQVEALGKLPFPPEYLIIMQMQDKDLYKRRTTQKFDPETGKVYTKQQYTNFDPDWMIFNRKFSQEHHDKIYSRDKNRKLSDATSSDNPITEEASDTEKRTFGADELRAITPEENLNVNDIDFPKIPHEILNRLFYRTEDFNIIVNDDLESFRFNFSDLQFYVQNFDKRKVLEVDAYWSPTIIFRRVWEFCESIGIQPVPVPVQIMRPMSMNFMTKKMDGGEDDDDDEYDDDDDDDDEDDEDEENEGRSKNDTTDVICEEESPTDVDWNSAQRAVCVRGLVDPRFRWRLSRWDNLCPVALKMGRSLPGKPELAVSFMDKVFFLSSKHAADQFINNPRPYLLPKMPTSPIKFIIIGHPLAGKTTFAKEMAALTDAVVIDVTKEVTRRFMSVKRDYMWKKRLKYALEASNLVNRENELRWQRQERVRRRDMHTWVENHLKAIAEAEILAMLERDRELLHKMRTELRKQSEYHAIGEVYLGDGSCRPDSDGRQIFNWKKFVSEAFKGRKEWSLQELLELAWDLFGKRRLYYKRKKRETLMKVFNEFSSSETDEEFGLVSPDKSPSESSDNETEIEDEDDESEMLSEGDTEDSDSHKKKRKKKKKKCIPLEVKPVKSEELLEPFLFESFDVDPDDPEVEESVRMRFPMIPFELVDIVPQPPLVGDQDPVVNVIVEEKLAKDEIHVDSMPPEIFVEILRRACAEVEIKYRKKDKHMAMSGGWIIENFPADIEKWRAILRTPQVCPDQIFLLLDLTEGNMSIWGRFKKLFKMLHPPIAPPNSADAGNLRLSGFQNNLSLDPILGEGSGTNVILEPREVIDENKVDLDEGGEGGPLTNPPIIYRGSGSEKGSARGHPLDSTTEDTEGEAIQPRGEVDPNALEVVTKSHFILSLLPRDNLVDVCSVSSSEEALIKIDLHRNQTQAFSEVGSSNEDMEKIMKGQEKYRLEGAEKDPSAQAEEVLSDDELETCSSFDQEDMQRRRMEILKLKPIYGEMSVCVATGEPTGSPESQKEVSSDITVQAYHKKGTRNPPGTPETELNPSFMDEEKRKNWNIPVPQEVEKGEVEMTAEEEEMKNALENEVKRLSKSLSEEYIKTPTEMGSYATLGAGGSVTNVNAIMANPIVQKLLSTKIESPKRKFFTQVRMFNEFWNMALPVSNQQGVKYWEVGLCDEETAREKAIFFWNELEARFEAKAKKIFETELKEEDDEILESLMRWGDPFEPGDIRHRSSNREKNDDDEDSPDDSEVDDDDETEDESEGSALKRMEKDELAALENKPDLYWKANVRREAERCFGDFKFYCPVTYFDSNLLRKGFQKYACKFKDRLYYCADESCQLRFVTNPKQFLPKAGPPKAPPPRICITGSPGCLQEEIASQLSTDFKVCYVNFRQRLHEIIKARYGYYVGPEWTHRIVPQSETENSLAKTKKNDDLFPNEKGESFDLEIGPEDDEVNQHVNFGLQTPSPSKKVQNIPSRMVKTDKSKHAIEEVTLKSLGLWSQHNIETIPLNSIDRTEHLTERKWQKLTWTEAHIQAFLENGIQLPDEVLDEFVLPLWKAQPFTEFGFILVGFPNTQEDIQYMIKRNCIPEHVFVMECKSVVIRNRLIVTAVDRWHREQNPSGTKSRRLSMRTKRAKDALDMQKLGIAKAPSNSGEIFPYQTEGRPEISEFERETWSYNDSISREIARALRYYHEIYSKGIDKMKKTMNRERFCWTPVDTNPGIHQGKHKVLDGASSILKYRNNVFEDTVRLSFPAAQALLDRAVFTLSPLLRWCPIELSKGNSGINAWNAPGIKKIPYLHRRFIYFIAGEKNARHFEENTWELTNQVLPLQSVPMYCMVLGKAKSGKTTLSKNLAERLGLVYVSCLEAVESVLAHAFVTEWAPVLREVNPSLASSGHQPMHLAYELLEYIRQGRAIPRYLVYRCLDLFLMNPKAQCNGVVFDDFPTIIDELIELNYREMSPCIVLNMRIPITEAYERCDRERKLELKDEDIPEESRDCIDHLWDQYGHLTSETYKWFADEYQNIYKIDGTQNPEVVFKGAAELCQKTQRKVQDYLVNLYYGRPNSLDGICPITSSLINRLNQEYGFYCPVALNDSDELVSVRVIRDLKNVVEYKNHIYLFSSNSAAQKFIKNPRRYTTQGCFKTPPKDLPQTLNVSKDDWEKLKDNWGFMDFDPVLYYANHHYKGLQRGDPKFCVVYRRKLYVFINEDNQKKFLKTPTKYWNLLLPMKIPRKTEPVNYDRITPYSYLSSKGMVAILKKVVKLMAEKRPRAPFMNVEQCAALYMGYYLKSQNMNSPYELRQKYRDAMFKMSTVKNETKEVLNDLQNFYGCRPRNLPDRLRKKLDEFIKYEHLPLEEKVHMPSIPGVKLGYAHVEPPFSETQVARKVRRLMNNMKDVEFKQNSDAFAAFTRKRKAAEEAAERAAQDAIEAAELAKQKLGKAEKRMTRSKSMYHAHGRGHSQDMGKSSSDRSK